MGSSRTPIRTPGSSNPFPSGDKPRQRQADPITSATQRSIPSSTLARGIITYSFFATPGASATATQMSKVSGFASFAVSIPLPFRGYLAGITLVADDTKTTGSCIFTARKNSAATSATLTWATGDSAEAMRFTPGTYSYERDDTIDVTFTTDATYLPITTQVEVTVILALTQQEA